MLHSATAVGSRDRGITGCETFDRVRLLSEGRNVRVDLPDPCIGEITNYPRMVDRDLNEMRLYDTPNTLCQNSWVTLALVGLHWVPKKNASYAFCHHLLMT